jgi:hypothetical protein
MHKRIILNPPDLSTKNLIYKAAQLRPYRKGGIRIEH